MPSANLNIQDTVSGLVEQLANTIVFFGVASVGTPNVTYAIGADSQAVPNLGQGPLAECVARCVRISKRKHFAVPVTASIAGVLSTVTKTPSNSTPLITVAGPPFDSY